MSSLQKLERDRTRADLASLNALLAQLTDEDVMMRSDLESRRDERAASIAALEMAPEHTASAALFVGGQPVAGVRGIEAEFGGNSVVMFQDLVAKLHGQEAASGNLESCRTNVEAKARFQVKRVQQKGRVVRQSCTLLRIDAAKANMKQATRVNLGPDPEHSGADEG
ncbi:MAG: hypothetical protein ABSG76_02500 [Xanthobacteraceae bacterium]